MQLCRPVFGRASSPLMVYGLVWFALNGSGWLHWVRRGSAGPYADWTDLTQSVPAFMGIRALVVVKTTQRDSMQSCRTGLLIAYLLHGAESFLRS